MIPTLDKSKVIYLAAILALATAGVLAWAVSHPCDCEKTETAPSYVETDQ